MRARNPVLNLWRSGAARSDTEQQSRPNTEQGREQHTLIVRLSWSSPERCGSQLSDTIYASSTEQHGVGRPDESVRISANQRHGADESAHDQMTNQQLRRHTQCATIIEFVGHDQFTGTENHYRYNRSYPINIRG